MKVVLSSIGKFHHFDLARALHSAGNLECILTSYPKCKLKQEGLPVSKIRSFPWLHAPFMVSVKLGGVAARFGAPFGEFSRRMHDRWAAAVLPPCDVFVGLSGHNLLAGRRAKTFGAKWICDRGSTHIQFQDNVLRSEYASYGLAFKGIHPAVVSQENAEYNECDLITVPSAYTLQSFLDEGVLKEKLRKVSYGVDLSRFYPVDQPKRGGFDVIFVGTITPRKGVRYLIDAFRRLDVPNKTLTLIGPIDPDLALWVKGVDDRNISFKGPMSQVLLKEQLSRSHVFVLPSVEEGLALVQAQAMACGCPVICSRATGGSDLFDDGVEGFIVKTGDVDAITSRMALLANNETLRGTMSAAALARVHKIGGWSSYGRGYISVLNELVEV